MTIDEAIIHAEEVANEKERLGAMGRGNPDKYAPSPEQCFKCAKDHRQLAEWLKELKTLREKRPHGEWVWKKWENSDSGDIICSECKCVYFEGVSKERMNYQLYPFCPNCGAELRKEGEAE